MATTRTLTVGFRNRSAGIRLLTLLYGALHVACMILFLLLNLAGTYYSLCDSGRTSQPRKACFWLTSHQVLVTPIQIEWLDLESSSTFDSVETYHCIGDSAHQGIMPCASVDASEVWVARIAAEMLACAMADHYVICSLTSASPLGARHFF